MLWIYERTKLNSTDVQLVKSTWNFTGTREKLTSCAGIQIFQLETSVVQYFSFRSCFDFSKECPSKKFSTGMNVVQNKGAKTN